MVVDNQVNLKSSTHLAVVVVFPTPEKISVGLGKSLEQGALSVSWASILLIPHFLRKGESREQEVEKMLPNTPDETPSSVLTLTCYSFRATATRWFWKGFPSGFCVPWGIPDDKDAPCPLKHWHKAVSFCFDFCLGTLFTCVFHRGQTHLFNLNDLRLTGCFSKTMLSLM